jgi:hypothetical protein
MKKKKLYQRHCHTDVFEHSEINFHERLRTLHVNRFVVVVVIVAVGCMTNLSPRPNSVSKV